jgi:hypothetical protein
MLIKPPDKAESKAYRATLKLLWGNHAETVRIAADLDVLPDLLTQPTDLAHDFVSEEVSERPLIVKQRIRSETEPVPVAPVLTELPDEVGLEAVEHVKTGKLDSVESRGLRVEGQSPRRAHLGTPDDPTAPIWEVEWRATVRLRCTERVRDGFLGECRLTCRPAPQTLSPEGRGGPVPEAQAVAKALSVQIPVRLRRVDVIQVSPAYTYFGRVKAGEERRRLVLLRALDDQEFEVKDASCDSPAYAARVTSDGAKKLHTVQVVFRSAESGQHSGSVRVPTSHPRCPQITFGVEGSVEEASDTGTVVAR